MLTHVVLPRWRDLLWPPAADPACAAAPWLGDGDGFWWLSRSAWSLAVLAKAAGLRLGRKPRVLLPAYFCNQSLHWLRQYVDPVFLPVDFDGRMSPPPPSVPADMAVVVHLFGYPAELAPWRAWADAAGALLVEDAAHAAGPCPGIGEHGDAVLYSPHKIFAQPDGALLVLRPRAMGWIPQVQAVLTDFQGKAPPVWDWRVKRGLQCSLPLPRPKGPVAFMDDPAGGSPPCTPKISSLSLRLAALARPGQAQAARRANARALWQLMQDWADWRLFQPLAGEHGPYRLVLRCANPNVAEEWYGRLHRLGLWVESWPDLPPEITEQSGGAARTLRRTLLLLPVHQTLAAERLCRHYAKARPS